MFVEVHVESGEDVSEGDAWTAASDEEMGVAGSIFTNIEERVFPGIAWNGMTLLFVGEG